MILPHAVLAGRDLDHIKPILAHEVIHVRRGDVLFGLLQSVAPLGSPFYPGWEGVRDSDGWVMNAGPLPTELEAQIYLLNHTAIRKSEPVVRSWS